MNSRGIRTLHLAAAACPTLGTRSPNTWLNCFRSENPWSVGAPRRYPRRDATPPHIPQRQFSPPSPGPCGRCARVQRCFGIGDHRLRERTVKQRTSYGPLGYRRATSYRVARGPARATLPGVRRRPGHTQGVTRANDRDPFSARNCRSPSSAARSTPHRTARVRRTLPPTPMARPVRSGVTRYAVPAPRTRALTVA